MGSGTARSVSLIVVGRHTVCLRLGAVVSVSRVGGRVRRLCLGQPQTSRPSSVNVVCSLTLIIRSPSSGNRGRKAKPLIADPSDR